ncbi:MAG: hypothetical protein V9E83_07870 [Baekduia sp.]
MPTKHRRINVTCDQQLRAALDAAAPYARAKSDAGLIRELALAGAKALEEVDVDETRAEILAIPGIIPARNPGGRLDWMDELLKQPVSNAGTEALEWARGDR